MSMDEKDEVNSEQAIREAIRADVEKEYEEKLAEELQTMRKKLEADNKLIIQEALLQWKKEQTPLSQEDMSKVLSQSYIEFQVKVPTDAGARDFTIRELPMSVEKKFYKIIKEKVIPRVKDFGSLNMSGDLQQNLQAIFDVIDPTMDLLAEITVLILDPKVQDKTITTEWVKDNLSAYRIWNILLAQAEANKLRDFFFGVSRTSQSGKIRPVGTLN